MLQYIASKVPMSYFVGNYAEVIPRIFIGNSNAAMDEDFLAKENIKFIICASNNKNDIIDHENYIELMFINEFPDIDYVDAGNVHASNMADMFQTQHKANLAADYLNVHYNRGEHILVHCALGINRSALIIGIFMIKHLKYSYQDTIKILTEANAKRHPLFPVLTNQTFRSMMIFS